MISMKTLIINGSPKRNGDTVALLNEFAEYLHGESMTLSIDSHIAPCSDCRHCWENPGCCIMDDMQDAYEYLRDCDNVVLASPVWFSSLSGVALNISSRLQMVYASRAFRKAPFPRKPKQGVLIIVGAQPGTELGPAQVARTILKLAGAERPLAVEVYAMHTDALPAVGDEVALDHVRAAAQRLNELHCQTHHY